MRQAGHAELEFHVAPFRNLLRPVYGVRYLFKQGAHFLFALDIELFRLHPHALVVRERFAGLNAHQHFLGVRVLLLQIVAVVGRNQRNVHLPRQGNQPRQYGFLLPQVVIHDLNIEILLAEDLLHFLHIGMGAFVLPVQQHFRQVAAQAGAQADQALVMFPDQVIVDPRLVVISRQESFADQVHQVLVSGVVLAQQDQVAVLPAGQGFVRPVPAYVCFAADDRFDPGVLHGVIKIDRAVQYAVVGNCAGIHPQLFQPIRKRADPAGAVQQTVLRVQMKMRKAHNPSGSRAAILCKYEQFIISQNSIQYQSSIHRLRLW